MTMVEPDKKHERRTSGRVEEMLTGWWKLGDSNFERFKTLDLSMDGALVVLDKTLSEGTLFELHLDMKANWSVAFDARVLWQRAIFFGKQQLTAVSYRFQQSQDQSMFGLWLQRKLLSQNPSRELHASPIAPSKPNSDWQPSIEEAPVLKVKERVWKKTFSQLTAKIPWIEAESLPQERRIEARGQVGLSVRCEFNQESFEGELLNVSLSGLCLFLPQMSVSGQNKKLLPRKQEKMLKPGERLDVVVNEDSLLLGGNRCRSEVVWAHPAKLAGAQEQSVLVVGVKFTSSPEHTKRTFIGDLLRRINYKLRQVRSELRFPVELQVKLELEGQRELGGMTLDISAGGAHIGLPQRVPTPCDAMISILLNSGEKSMRVVKFSSRLLRRTVDRDDMNCYAVAFRKGQKREHFELSKWLSSRLRVQNLNELVPNFSKIQKTDE